jgi:hypothetical protein
MSISKEFTNAVEADKVCSAFYNELLRHNTYNRDLHRLLKNITKMVEELSKLEVVARRSRQRYKVDDKIIEIKQALDYLDKLMLMQKLMS